MNQMSEWYRACDRCGIYVDDGLRQNDQYYCEDCAFEKGDFMSVLDDLNTSERSNLRETHRRHTATMNQQEKEKHTLNNIIKVERNHEEKCFHVHYAHGEWYHYTLTHEWY